MSPLDSNKLPRRTNGGFLVGSLCFVTGWTLGQAAFLLELEPIGYLLAWPSCGLCIATLIHGSWRVVPRIILGFLIGFGLIMGLHLCLYDYYLQVRDYFFFASFGCCVSAVLGSQYLAAQSPHVDATGVVHLTLWIRAAILFHRGAILVVGAFASLLIVGAMHAANPEAVVLVGAFAGAATLLFTGRSATLRMRNARNL